MNLPLPDVDKTEFASHWSGLREGKIFVPKCLGCGRTSWPPRPMCPICHELEHEWVATGHEGIVYSWTVVEHRTLPGFDTPYAVVLVSLDDQPGIRLLGGYVGDVSTITVGQPVRATFRTITDRVTLIDWQSMFMRDIGTGTK